MQIKTAQITTFSNHIITIENRSFTNTRLNYLATNLLIILDDKKLGKCCLDFYLRPVLTYLA